MRALIATAFMLAAQAGAQPLPVPKDVQAVIDRSHDSRADYSVFVTVEITVGGQTHREIQSEFQHGPLHRVEVSTARVLANCDSKKELIFNVELQTIGTGPDTGACGISMSSDEVISGRILPSIQGGFGKADVIELVGKKFVRRYAVTADGIIVSNDYDPRSPDVDFMLHTLKAEVIRGAPEPSMFQPDSLERSYGPINEARDKAAAGVKTS